MKALLITTLVALAVPVFAADDEKDFQPLFNGKDTTGWHLRNPKGPNSWSVADGVLKNTVNKGEHGTDLVTDAKFWNFTVRYEYQVPEKSNSGMNAPAAANGNTPSNSTT